MLLVRGREVLLSGAHTVNMYGSSSEDFLKHSYFSVVWSKEDFDITFIFMHEISGKV